MRKRRTIGECIDHYMKLCGIKRVWLAEYLGVEAHTVTNWIKGRTYPDLLRASDMAALFGVSLDALVDLERGDDEDDEDDGA